MSCKAGLVARESRVSSQLRGEHMQGDEEAMLQRAMLETRGSLAAAYAAMNDRHAAAGLTHPSAPPAAGAGAGSGSDGSSDNSHVDAAALRAAAPPGGGGGGRGRPASVDRATLKAEIAALQAAAAREEAVRKAGGDAIGFRDYADPRQAVAAYHVQRSRLLTVVRVHAALRCGDHSCSATMCRTHPCRKF